MTRRIARRLVLAGAVTGCLIAIGAAAAFFIGDQMTGSVTRIPNVFRGLRDASRPAIPAAGRRGTTILVVGSDSEQPRNPAGMRQADAVMLVHIEAERRSAAVLSIPRNAWVSVPGHGMMTLFEPLAVGGPPLMIETVEQLTGIRIDHYAVLDFGGFRAIVKALGGVQVAVARQTRREGVTFHPGLNALTPRSALVYVSTAARPARCRCWQRNGLPGGDLTRVQRQQNLVRAILVKAASWHLLGNPFALYHLLNVVSHSVSVDATFTNTQLAGLALQLSRLRGRNVTFLTTPVRGLGWRDREGVVYLNRQLCRTLWPAVLDGQVARWAKSHPATLTPMAPF